MVVLHQIQGVKEKLICNTNEVGLCYHNAFLILKDYYLSFLIIIVIYRINTFRRWHIKRISEKNCK